MSAFDQLTKASSASVAGRLFVTSAGPLGQNGLPAGWSELETAPSQDQSSPISAEDIEICRREDGEEWLLGQGTYGSVSSLHTVRPVCLGFPR